MIAAQTQDRMTMAPRSYKARKKMLQRAAEEAKARGAPVPPRNAKAGEPKDTRREIRIGREPPDPDPEHKQEVPAAKRIPPTPERLAKPDAPAKGQSGVHRSPPPIERLRDRQSLDDRPWWNEAMYNEAVKLQEQYHLAGFGGIGAQDLSRIAAGNGDPAHMMPQSASAAIARRELIRKLNMMGWFPWAPLRGSGRVVFAVVCEERTLADAGRQHCGIKETKRAEAVAKDRLCAGLMMLVDLSKGREPPNSSVVLGAR